MKIKVIKCSVGGMNSDIVMFDEEFICDESEFSFKMSDKEMEGGCIDGGVDFELFEEEVRGEGWVMYGYDGIGVFVVDEGYDVDKCKDEYDVKYDV